MLEVYLRDVNEYSDIFISKVIAMKHKYVAVLY